MAFELERINAAAAADPAGFIAACDARYAQKIAATAQRIIEHLPQSPIVLLAGPSGSGKTTTAMRLRDELARRGVTGCSIGMDNYYKTVSPDETPRTPSGEYDLESPLCLDMELMNAHFTALSRGEDIFVPKYDFARHRRADEPSAHLRLGENEVAIFEGIHALNPAVTAAHPEAFRLYVAPASSITDAQGEYVFKASELRLVRRLVRDSLFRGSAPERTMAMWANVRAGERKYIDPFRTRADHQLDTAFACEPCVMRAAALALLERADTGLWPQLSGAVAALRRFEAVDPALLAPDAMLREFVGGGIYSY